MKIRRIAKRRMIRRRSLKKEGKKVMKNVIFTE
jgi:hypothetical protein